MKTIIRANAAQDFLALVPDLAGFQPVDSIVVVAFRGTRSCGALRVNLPHSNDPDVLSAVASSLVGMVCKIAGVDAVAPIIYTTERFESSSVPPFGDMVNAVIFHAEQSGFMVRDALCVAADGWASYCDSSTPSGGHPLSLIDDSRVKASVAAPVSTRPLADQYGAVPTAPADFATRHAVARVIKRFRSAAEDSDALGEPSKELDALLDLPALAEQVLSVLPEKINERDAGALLFGMQRSATRDMLLMHWSFGAEAGTIAEQENERFERGERDAGVESARKLWGEGPRPDPERIECAIALLLELVARSPRNCKPAALSMLAWLNWALGRSSRAGVLVDMALALNASYGFADIIHRMLCAGRLPEWAFDVPTDNGEHSTPAHNRSTPARWR